MTPTPDFGTGEVATKKFVGSNVDDLPVSDLHGGHVSCWLVTEEDLQRIRETGRVFLWVQGPAHPPVALTSEPPPPPSDVQTDSAPRNGKAADA